MSKTQSAHKTQKHSINKSVIRKPAYPRAPSNPYRENSSYATCYDIIVHLSAKNPIINKQDVIKALSQTTHKSELKCSYDCAVVLSVTKDSYHKSAKHASTAYNIDKRHDGKFQLVILSPPTK